MKYFEPRPHTCGRVFYHKFIIMTTNQANQQANPFPPNEGDYSIAICFPNNLFTLEVLGIGVDIRQCEGYRWVGIPRSLNHPAIRYKVITEDLPLLSARAYRKGWHYIKQECSWSRLLQRESKILVTYEEEGRE